MVLRKQRPPRLENLTRWNAGSKSRSPTSPTPSSVSSPDRLARLNSVSSQDSVYSADLNTSPAFKLMSLEEAQRSSMGSPTSHPPSSRTDESGATSAPNNPGALEDPETTTDSKEHTIPSLLVASRQPDVADNEWQRPTPEADAPSRGELPVQLQSNNPFRKPRRSHSNQDMLDLQQGSGRGSHATSGSEPLGHNEGYIPMTARLSLFDQQDQESWTERPVSSSHSSAVWDNHQPLEGQTPFPQHTSSYLEQQATYLQGEQSSSFSPAVVIQPSDQSHTNNEQPHQSFQLPGKLGSDTGLNTPSATVPSATTATSHELIDLDVSDTLGTETGSHRAASSVYSGDKKDLSAPPVPEKTPPPAQNKNVLEEQTSRPRSRAGTSAIDAARQTEQRSEKYAIRHINWVDHTSQSRQSPILVQNQNGPCPLLALINALVLRANSTTPPPIVRALQIREHISLGLLIEALFEELTTCLGPHEEFPDIEALTKFLTMLHTGMNVNPRLTLESMDSVGTFFQTSNLEQYGTFGVPLIHGWLAPWSSPVHTAMAQVAQYHEDIQLLHFRKEELEDRALQGRSLSPEEEQKMEYIHTIQRFVEIENATQLSRFGLTQLRKQLAPGSVSIFFRNDHFSTLYKHPQSHQLYTLVTDAGYANHAEIVWESLVDVTGFNGGFLSGDFRPVGHDASGTSAPAGPRASSTTANRPPATSEDANGPLLAQEQSDADYAYALSLQFQEEERREHSRTQADPRRTNNHPRTSGRPSPSMGNPPARSSSVAQTPHPPRHPALDPEPEDPNAPPPPYEQATSGPRYTPRQRESQPMGSAQGSPYPGIRYSQNQYPHRHSGVPVSTGPNRYKDRNKECILM